MKMKSKLKAVGTGLLLCGFIAVTANNLHLRHVIEDLQTREALAEEEIASVELSVSRVSTATDSDSRLDSPICLGAEEADRLLSSLNANKDVRISSFPLTEIGSGLLATFEIAEDRLDVVPTISPDGYVIGLAISADMEGSDETHSIAQELWTGQTLVFRPQGDPNTILFVKASITQGQNKPAMDKPDPNRVKLRAESLRRKG